MFTRDIMFALLPFTLSNPKTSRQFEIYSHEETMNDLTAFSESDIIRNHNSTFSSSHQISFYWNYGLFKEQFCPLLSLPSSPKRVVITVIRLAGILTTNL